MLLFRTIIVQRAGALHCSIVAQLHVNLIVKFEEESGGSQDT